MSLTLTSRVVADPTALSTRVEGESIVLSRSKGLYVAIQGSGDRIWQLLATETSVDDVIHTIQNEFDVDADQCTRDVLAFIQELADLSLVRLVA